MALSSGFLTYPASVHSDCGDAQHEIAASPIVAPPSETMRRVDAIVEDILMLFGLCE